MRQDFNDAAQILVGLNVAKTPRDIDTFFSILGTERFSQNVDFVESLCIAWLTTQRGTPDKLMINWAKYQSGKNGFAETFDDLAADARKFTRIIEHVMREKGENADARVQLFAKVAAEHAMKEADSTARQIFIRWKAGKLIENMSSAQDAARHHVKTVNKPS